MTEDEIKTTKRLSLCTFFPATYEKRFVRDMTRIAEDNPEYELSEKQKVYLAKVKHRYRKQLSGVR